MKKLFFGLLIAFVMLAGAVAPASTNTCGGIHRLDPFNIYLERDAFAEMLVESNVPAVAIPTRNGMIPAVLLNVNSGSKLRSFFRNSIGTVVSYQPDYRNDHGMIRLFSILADLDSPGARRTGELHKTGISWVSLEANLKYSLGKEKVKIEVAYSLTPEEKKVAALYHLMRRGAIIRVPFTFGGGRVDKDLPNMLENTGEHCFVFCHGSGIDSHIDAIQSKFQKYQIGGLEQVVKSADVQTWLAAVEAKLSKINIDDPKALSHDLPIRVGAPESLAGALAKLDKNGQSEMLNWIVGYHLSLRYSKLLKELGIGGDNAYNGIHNPRATALLIHDGATLPADFMTSEYQARGVFSTYDHQKAMKLVDAFEGAKRASLNPKPTGLINKILNLFN